MKKIKGLLYCCKAKPSLMKYENIDGYYTDTDPVLDKRALLNGKIVAECDFEVEEIVCDGYAYLPLNSNPAELETKSCLTEQELEKYFTKKYGLVGYALHISNLKIFDKPRELSDYHISYFNKEFNMMREKHIEKSPKNMCRAFDIKDTYILISIKPEWLCKILNGEQTILIKKQVLKCMKGNE